MYAYLSGNRIYIILTDEEVAKRCGEAKTDLRFYDPNPAAAAADHIAKPFVEVNQHKIEVVLGEASSLKTEPEKPTSP